MEAKFRGALEFCGLVNYDGNVNSYENRDSNDEENEAISESYAGKATDEVRNIREVVQLPFEPTYIPTRNAQATRSTFARTGTQADRPVCSVIVTVPSVDAKMEATQLGKDIPDVHEPTTEEKLCRFERETLQENRDLRAEE